MFFGDKEESERDEGSHDGRDLVRSMRTAVTPVRKSLVGRVGP